MLRSLTAGEITLAQSIFGNMIDYSSVKISNEKYTFFQPDRTAMAPDGNIYFPEAGGIYFDDYSLLPNDGFGISYKGFFLHELTHVWQYQQLGEHLVFHRDPIFGSLPETFPFYYDYGDPSQVDFYSLNIEQQADLIKHYYFALETGKTALDPTETTSYTLEEISAAIPDEIKNQVAAISDNGSQDFRTILLSEQVGSMFGSVLASHFADGNILADIALDTAFSSVLSNVAESIAIYGTGTPLVATGGPGSLLDSVNAAWTDFPADAVNAFQNAGIGAIAAFFTAGLLDALDVDGLPAQIINSTTNAAIPHLFTNLLNLGDPIMVGGQQLVIDGVPQVYTYSTGLPTAVTSAAGAFFGSYLATEITLPDTELGQIGGSLGGAVGAILGAPAGFIGSAIGSFVGNLIGGFIGDLFGDEDYPRAAGVVAFDPLTSTFSVSDIRTWDGGSYETAEVLAQLAADSFTSVLSVLDGTVLNPEAIVTGGYGHDEEYLGYFDNPISSWPSRHFTEVKDLLGYGIITGLKDVEIAGGNIYAKRAFYSTLDNIYEETETQTVTEWHTINDVLTEVTTNYDVSKITGGLDTLLGNLAVAAEYQQYLENHLVINTLIAENPNSAFALGWVITLLQASQLGLDVRHASDWYGGWGAYLGDKELNSSTLSFSMNNFGRQINGENLVEEAIVIKDSVVASAKEKFLATETNSRFNVDDNGIIRELTQISGYQDAEFTVGDAIAIAPYVIGGSGADFISLGDQGGDALGGAGNDVIVGGKLDDWMFGGSGNDLLVAGGGHGDYLNGEGGDDRLSGDELSEWVEGGSGDDVITGRDGEDILQGGQGNDFVDGGKGADIYHYQSGDSIDYVKDSGDLEDTDEVRLKDAVLSNLTYYTSSSDDDMLVKVGSGADDWIVLEESAFDGFQSVERIVDVNGQIVALGSIQGNASHSATSGSAVTGTSVAETLAGGIHNDLLDGGAANDSLSGSYGSDTYQFDSGDGTDVISERGFRQDVDILSLGSGLSSTAVAIARTSSTPDTLTLGFGVNGSIAITNFGGTPENGIEAIRYGNGVSHTTYDIAKLYLQAASSANNDLVGFDSNDVVLSGAGHDTIRGGKGNDHLNGGTNNDTYIYNADDGHDRIYEGTYADSDTLSFGATISSSDLVFHRIYDDTTGLLDDLGISFASRDGSLFIRNALDDYTEIGTFTFADSTTWSVQNVVNAMLAQHSTSGSDVIMGGGNADAITGLAGNDIIRGFDGNDTLTGGAGNDFLMGDYGSDTYIYNAGDGHDRIYDYVNGTDTLSFGSGIAAGNLLFHRNYGDNALEDDLGVTFSGAEGYVLVLNQFNSYSHLENFLFADSTTWNYQNLMTAMLAQHSTSGSDIIMGGHNADSITGLAGNDIISGLDGNDTFTGGTGNDFLEGGNNNDTYVYTIGDGHDRIYDYSGADNLNFGAGIATGDVVFHRSFTTVTDQDDLGITFANADGYVLIKDQFNQTSTHVENLVFSDATSWNYQSVMTAMLAQHSTSGSDIVMGGHLADSITGFAGNDNIRSFDGNDTIQGGTGNDFLEGGFNNDTYIYNIGDGHDRIYDTGSTDTLSFGAGISSSDIIITRLPANINSSGTSWASNKDLLITFHNTDGSILIRSQADSGPKIENFSFTGGSTLTYTQLLAAATVNSYSSIIGNSSGTSLSGTAGDNAIFGAGGNDTITGGAGNDHINSGSGNDIYHFGRGDGHDTITYTADTGTDTLIFDDSITSGEAEITVNPQNNDLIIHVGNDSVTIRDFSYSSQTLSSFVFADVTLSLAELLENIYQAAASTSDYLYGTEAAESLLGGAGDDVIYAGGGSDTIRGGAGNDYLEGGEGYNIYHFGRGDGHDTIKVYAYYETDTLVFEDSIVSSEAEITINPLTKELIISIGDDSVTIRSFSDIDRLLDSFVFADVTLSMAQLLETIYLAENATSDYLYGTDAAESISGGAGDDSFYGLYGNDSIRGGTGNDFMDGGQGVNTYYFGRGDGHDTISVSTYTNTDTIVFEDGITFSEAVLTINPETKDLIISIGDDSVTLRNFSNNSSVLDSFVFDDVTLSLAELLETVYLEEKATADYLYGTDFAESIAGGAGDDAIYAKSGNDSIRGGAGNDFLVGGYGTDTYYFTLGDGQDIIRDPYGSGDTLSFGAHIYAEDIEVSYVYDDTSKLILRIQGTDDSVSIDSSVGNILFADGTTWTYAAAAELAGSQSGAAIRPAATWGDDILIGGTGNDTLAGSRGNDLLRGGDGADTYRYNLGDGRDAIFDSSNDSDQDRIIFGAGITTSMVVVSVSPNDANDIILTIGTTGGSIYLDGQKTGGGIELIEFADSTVWTGATISSTSASINPTSGNDLLIGNAQSNTIDGGAGNDLLYGGAGADVYSYSIGDGSDIITDLGLDNGTDKLVFTDIASTAVSVGYDSLTGSMTIGYSSATITLERQVEESYRGVELFEFSNSVTWTKNDLEQAYLASRITTGDDLIEGFASADTLGGGAGTDTLMGSKGSDTYLFHFGNGEDEIYDHGYSTDTDTILLGSGITAANTTVLRSVDASNDIILDFGGGDSITLRQALVQGSKGIEAVVFNGGPTWSMSDIMEAYFDGLATSGADTISGTNIEDVIDGLDGNDIISGGASNDTISGGNGDDLLDGGFGNDVLYGNADADELNGSFGNDTLIGGETADSLTGGVGNDVFVFTNLTHSTDSARDVIADFVHLTDKIDLTGLGFSGIQAGASSGTVLGYSVVSGQTIIDADGLDFSIALTGNITLTASDFIFS